MSAPSPNKNDKDVPTPALQSPKECISSESPTRRSPTRGHKRKSLSIDLLAASPNAKLKDRRPNPGVNLPLNFRNKDAPIRETPITARFSAINHSKISEQFGPSSPLSKQPISPYPFGSDAFEFYRGRIESATSGSPMKNVFELPSAKSASSLQNDFENSFENSFESSTLFVQPGNPEGMSSLSQNVDSLLKGNLFSPTAANSADITIGQLEPRSANRMATNSRSLLGRLNSRVSASARTPLETPKREESDMSTMINLNIHTDSKQNSAVPKQRESFDTLTLSPLNKDPLGADKRIPTSVVPKPPVFQFSNATANQPGAPLELAHLNAYSQSTAHNEDPSTAIGVVSSETSNNQVNNNVTDGQTESQDPTVRKKRPYKKRKPVVGPRKATRQRRQASVGLASDTPGTANISDNDEVEVELVDIEWRSFSPISEPPKSQIVPPTRDANYRMGSFQPIGQELFTKNTLGSKLKDDEESKSLEEDAKATQPLPQLFLNSLKQELECDPFRWLVKAVISCANPIQARHFVESGEFPTVMMLLLNQKSHWSTVSLVVLIRLITRTRGGELFQLSFIRLEILSLLFQILQGQNFRIKDLRMVTFWNNNPKIYSLFMSTLLAVSLLPCMGKNSALSIEDSVMLDGQVTRFVERFEPYFLKSLVGEPLPPLFTENSRRV